MHIFIYKQIKIGSTPRFSQEAGRFIFLLCTVRRLAPRPPEGLTRNIAGKGSYIPYIYIYRWIDRLIKICWMCSSGSGTFSSSALYRTSMHR